MSVVRGWRLLAGSLTICLVAAGTMVRGQSNAGAAPPAQPAQGTLLSEQAFKNVQLLRGIPVKEFMETMGFFAAALALNCADCHETTSWADYAVDTPIKQRARQMMLMTDAINRANFGGQRRVTCFTCHRGSQAPKAVPSLALQYSVPPDEDPDEIMPNPNARVTVTPEQVLDKYLQAVGGAAAAAKLTSYTAKGTYEGFDSDFEQVPVEIFARAPEMRTTIIHMRGADVTYTFDGREAWSAGPADLTPVTVMPLVGAALDGARLDARLAFPGQIKQTLTDWRAGFPRLTIDDRPVVVIEGKTPQGAGVKLYFDNETGLLVRSVRYSVTAVGTVPINVVYSNYQEVPGLGVKVPYTFQVTWTNGRGTYNITSLQPNTAIDAARFGKPAPPAEARN